MTLAIDALKARVKPLLAELEEIGSEGVLLRLWNIEAQTLLTFIRIAQMGETDRAAPSPTAGSDGT